VHSDRPCAMETSQRPRESFEGRRWLLLVHCGQGSWAIGLL